MERIATAVINALSRELGNELESAYLYGSVPQRTYELGESDINLLLVVAETLDIHRLRRLFMPLWQEYGRRLRRAPVVATRRTLARHLLLNPTLAHHLSIEGRPLLQSGGLLAGLPAQPTLTAEDMCAYWAQEALLASAALAPTLWSSEEQARHMQRLRSLGRRLLRQNASPQETAVALFARIQTRLATLISKLPNNYAWESNRVATSPLVPGLQATYTRDMESIILVFSQFSAEQLSSINWSKLAERLGKEYKGFYVTSSQQLRLICHFETPLDLFFKRIKRTWGEDPLRDLTPTTRYKLRQAARRPSTILLDTLPQAYLTNRDDEMGKLIHDMQNRLLNVQLEGELLARLGLTPLAKPPVPLPGREASAPERINAILAHLDWWSEHYTQTMLAATG